MQRIMACKTCAALKELDFYGLSFLDATYNNVGVCEICGGYRPVFECYRRKRHRSGGISREQETRQKILRNTTGDE